MASCSFLIYWPRVAAKYVFVTLGSFVVVKTAAMFLLVQSGSKQSSKQRSVSGVANMPSAKKAGKSANEGKVKNDLLQQQKTATAEKREKKKREQQPKTSQYRGVTLHRRSGRYIECMNGRGLPAARRVTFVIQDFMCSSYL